jgi:hypothetical protein
MPRVGWTFGILGAVNSDEEGHYIEDEWEGEPLRHPVIFSSGHDIDDPDPVAVTCDGARCMHYRGIIYSVDSDRCGDAETALRLKHHLLERKRELDRIRHEVEAFENLPMLAGAKREQITEAVRLFVWQRDRGLCVICGRNYRLEFDHVIPVALGGSSTERNIQLLCEPCNRRKGAQIASS